ncbi:NIPSNAP family protein [Micromonospora sp. NBC_00617]|uniref:NIPSNAP family protein n=1 Tax=Micromonospora sp. NBC_00617 TaxID=2903587 RepID=UPI0030E00773
MTRVASRAGWSVAPPMPTDRAEALFSFESLAAYERYRARFGQDPEFVAADAIRDESGCVVRYERTFMRPLLPGDDLAVPR